MPVANDPEKKTDKGSNSIDIGGGENKFPHEYSVSGWFRMIP